MGDKSRAAMPLRVESGWVNFTALFPGIDPTAGAVFAQVRGLGEVDIAIVDDAPLPHEQHILHKSGDIFTSGRAQPAIYLKAINIDTSVSAWIL